MSAGPPEEATVVPSFPVDFGKYRLTAHLARGGMGDVFLASLPGEFGFEKQLVVKTIRPELAENQRFVELFAAEARTTVALSHPNIVPIYELGRSEDGTLYIAMGRVDGPSVYEFLRRLRGAPPREDQVATALFIAREVLDGLAYAHSDEQGHPSVVHRDITPGNVLIDRSGRVQIVDFGIAMPAQLETNSTGEDDGTAEGVRKGPGSRMGSVGYMSPEQARGEPVDPRADVFSVACVLFELVTLERAFPHEGVWVEPDFDRLPAFLQPLLRRCLHLDVDHRPADASLFLRELAPLLAEHAPAFGSQDLARHLRASFPDAVWRAKSHGPGPSSLTPATRATKLTQAFASRLESGDAEPEAGKSDDAEPIVAAAPSLGAARPQRPSSASRIPLVVGLAALAGAAALILLRSPGPRGRSLAALDEGPTALETQTPSATTGEEQRAETGNAEIVFSGDDVPKSAPPTARELIVPTGAKVLVDGETLPGPPFEIRLTPGGTVDVTISKRGHADLERTLTEATWPSEAIELRPLGNAFLTVTAEDVTWAKVEIDGKARGSTPMFKEKVLEGSHKVKVICMPEVCGVTRTWKKTIDLDAGAHETVRFR